ncbi:hypothetical protein BJ973_005792 [Actinoplanes tereljensis]|uniref:Uncharacterized protein n=1 Tax=Paractinoplanes tereljensis TaxID=571912 RepID=A0A919NZC9_9ACTN|nr:hypothetical protein [Actinoplanes tereljensis]GIF26432.1 hypothetical protein Ate02nite_91620 [Actinoplanes tereljensis]
MKLVADLFDPEPQVWGLRGDPWVWQAMRDHLGDTYLPPTLGEAEAMLYTAFNRIVGVDLFAELEPSVYRPEFAHGGLSSGHIHLQTWRIDLLPLLVDRAQALL